MAQTKPTTVKGEKVKPNTLVEVKWKKSPFHKEGSTSMVHPEQAKKMAAAGRCTIVGKPVDSDKESSEV